MLVPPMVVALINCGLEDEARVKKCLLYVKRYASLHYFTLSHISNRSTLYSVVAGAAPLDAATQARFQRHLPSGSSITQIWAMTELSCIATYFYPPTSDATGSVGTFIPNLAAKIVDDDGNEIGPYDIRGELCVRGPTVIRGYLDNPRADSESFDEDGYFHTGDIAILSSKNDLWYIVDRKKELIKVRGFQVAPAEFEGVIFANRGVMVGGVFGVVGWGGEVPRAHVIKRDGVELKEGEVMGWVGERLAGYKQLEGGVVFVRSIPKTASGKILKRVLREEARREGRGKL